MAVNRFVGLSVCDLVRRWLPLVSGLSWLSMEKVGLWFVNGGGGLG